MFHRPQKCLFLRSVAWSVLFAYVFTTHFSAPSFAAPTTVPKTASHSIITKKIPSLEVPKKWGSLGETYQGSSSKTIILIQDAHAIAEAQKNISHLIEHLHTTLEISTVAVEGTDQKLEPLIYQEYPEQEILKVVFDEYLEKGEIPGAVYASVFGSKELSYKGVENWPLYEKGIELYLKASQAKTQALEKLKAEQRQLQLKKENTYSLKLLEVDQIIRSFQKNQTDILEAIQQLNPYLSPSKNSSISLILDEEKNLGAIKKLQAKEFFNEFQTYLGNVKNHLFENNAQRKLDQETQRLALKEKLLSLEATREEWEQIKASHEAGLETWQNFYKNAEVREKSFVDNTVAFMKARKSKNALVIVGGFHVSGITSQLREKNISYAVITPQISKVPDSSNYHAHMQGKVSWEKDFKVKNGEINLYKAFRATTTQKLFSKTKESLGILKKSWHDRIILALSRQNRITQAREYTRFLKQKSLSQAWAKNFEQFQSGLKQLEAKQQLTSSNIFNLLKASQILTLGAGTNLIVLRRNAKAALLSPPIVHSESRGQKHSTEPHKAAFSEARIKEKLQVALKDLDSFVSTINKIYATYEVSSNGHKGFTSQFLYEATKNDKALQMRVSELKIELETLLSKKKWRTRKYQIAFNAIQALGIGHVVMITPEMAPVSQSGGMAMVMNSLPLALSRKGVPVTIITNLYHSKQGKKHRSAQDILKNGIRINGKKIKVRRSERSVQIPLGSGEEPKMIKGDVFLAEFEGIQIKLLYHPEYTNSLYYSPEDSSDSEPQVQRGLFLGRGALEIIKDHELEPNVIHANDWMAAASLGFIQTDPRYAELKGKSHLHLSIHNLGRYYQGFFDNNPAKTEQTREHLYKKLFALEEESHYEWLADPSPEGYGFMNFLAWGIRHARSVNTVSLPYAKDSLTPAQGEALHEVLQKKGEHYYGISNGVDLRSIRWGFALFALKSMPLWRALTLSVLWFIAVPVYWVLSKLLGFHFSFKEFQEKSFLEFLPHFKKVALKKTQEKYGLSENPNAILISMFGRISEQKGVVLVGEQARKILSENPEAQLLIGGPVAKGDPDAEAFVEVIRELEKDFPGRVKGSFKWNEHSEVLEAMLASKLFLMPSKYEPGGLTQLEALAAGTLIIYHDTGGVSATMVPFDPASKKGNAFSLGKHIGESFKHAGEAFYEAVKRALQVLRENDSRAYEKIVREEAADSASLDWKQRAALYITMYQKELGVLDHEYPHLQSARDRDLPQMQAALSALASKSESRADVPSEDFSESKIHEFQMQPGEGVQKNKIPELIKKLMEDGSIKLRTPDNEIFYLYYRYQEGFWKENDSTRSRTREYVTPRFRVLLEKESSVYGHIDAKINEGTSLIDFGFSPYPKSGSHPLKGKLLNHFTTAIQANNKNHRGIGSTLWSLGYLISAAHGLSHYKGRAIGKGAKNFYQKIGVTITSYEEETSTSGGFLLKSFGYAVDLNDGFQPPPLLIQKKPSSQEPPSKSESRTAAFEYTNAMSTQLKKDLKKGVREILKYFQKRKRGLMVNDKDTHYAIRFSQSGKIHLIEKPQKTRQDIWKFEAEKGSRILSRIFNHSEIGLDYFDVEYKQVIKEQTTLEEQTLDIVNVLNQYLIDVEMGDNDHLSLDYSHDFKQYQFKRKRKPDRVIVLIGREKKRVRLKDLTSEGQKVIEAAIQFLDNLLASHKVSPISSPDMADLLGEARHYTMEHNNPLSDLGLVEHLIRRADFWPQRDENKDRLKGALETLRNDLRNVKPPTQEVEELRQVKNEALDFLKRYLWLNPTNSILQLANPQMAEVFYDTAEIMHGNRNRGRLASVAVKLAAGNLKTSDQPQNSNETEGDLSLMEIAFNEITQFNPVFFRIYLRNAFERLFQGFINDRKLELEEAGEYSDRYLQDIKHPYVIELHSSGTLSIVNHDTDLKLITVPFTEASSALNSPYINIESLTIYISDVIRADDDNEPLQDAIIAYLNRWVRGMEKIKKSIPHLNSNPAIMELETEKSDSSERPRTEHHTAFKGRSETRPELRFEQPTFFENAKTRFLHSVITALPAVLFVLHLYLNHRDKLTLLSIVATISIIAVIFAAIFAYRLLNGSQTKKDQIIREWQAKAFSQDIMERLEYIMGKSPEELPDAALLEALWRVLRLGSTNSQKSERVERSEEEAEDASHPFFRQIGEKLSQFQKRDSSSLSESSDESSQKKKQIESHMLVAGAQSADITYWLGMRIKAENPKATVSGLTFTREETRDLYSIWTAPSIQNHLIDAHQTSFVPFQFDQPAAFFNVIHDFIYTEREEEDTQALIDTLHQYFYGNVIVIRRNVDKAKKMNLDESKFRRIEVNGEYPITIYSRIHEERKVSKKTEEETKTSQSESRLANALAEVLAGKVKENNQLQRIADKTESFFQANKTGPLLNRVKAALLFIEGPGLLEQTTYEREVQKLIDLLKAFLQNHPDRRFQALLHLPDTNSDLVRNKRIQNYTQAIRTFRQALNHLVIRGKLKGKAANKLTKTLKQLELSFGQTRSWREVKTTQQNEIIAGVSPLAETLLPENSPLFLVGLTGKTEDPRIEAYSALLQFAVAVIGAEAIQSRSELRAQTSELKKTIQQALPLYKQYTDEVVTFDQGRHPRVSLSGVEAYLESKMQLSQKFLQAA